ncbi:unnamed protein product [Blepharisma stoltei]|uniref:Uncharacterized protein n=1 Tax=Blepharisma stoltei TaxID=1481888 RepID=A0AAU9K8N0_9CILI|nr:unnamed protein product [Blepharisma stoltei]
MPIPFNFSHIKIVMIISVILINLVAASPSQPKWPQYFISSITDTILDENQNQKFTNGTYYFNFLARSSRIDLEDGQYDPLCKLNGFEDLIYNPCRIYATGGNTFIFYPVDSYCCWCCNASQGCGNIYPNALLRELEFLGENEIDGKSGYFWKRDDYAYFETIGDNPENRDTIIIIEESKNITFESMNRTLPDQKTFDLPWECKVSHSCPEESLCGRIRKKGIDNLKDISPIY